MTTLAHYLLAYAVAFAGAIGFIYVRRRHKRKPRFLIALKILFMPKIWLSKSSLLDYQYVLAAFFVFPSLLAYATLSGELISSGVSSLLTGSIGPHAPIPHAYSFYLAAMTTALYITYEFAYWLNHYISHKFKFLWEFHKLHHAATVLTPMTLFRVHIADSMVFANMVAIAVGIVQGGIAYAFGEKIALDAAAGANFTVYAFLGLYGHLQHSQLWIPFTCTAGKIYFSPAHHQLHHSNNPTHYDSNFGNSLAVFDWLFGTLHMPQRGPEKLVYGVDDDAHLRGFVSSNVRPFFYSARQIALGIQRMNRRMCLKTAAGSAAIMAILHVTSVR